MSNSIYEAFVYVWINRVSNRIYIGYHKGSFDDGYICSSQCKDFWVDFINNFNSWQRFILHQGTKRECLQVEQQLIREAKVSPSIYTYNMGHGGYIKPKTPQVLRSRKVHKPRKVIPSHKQDMKEWEQSQKDGYNLGMGPPKKRLKASTGPIMSDERRVQLLEEVRFLT